MRIEGWEKRLNELVVAARAEKYALGKHDCALFVIGVVKSLTGVDYSSRVKGRYATSRGAFKLIRKLASSGRDELRDAVSSVLSLPPVAIARTQRGDPVLYKDSAGREHLGIHLGSSVIVLGEYGSLMIPPKQCICGWNT